MLTEAQILTALRDCFDPEVKLNLVDLGLIYRVDTGPDPHSTPAWPRQWVKVTMTLTTPQCPASGLIFEQVHNRLAGIRHRQSGSGFGLGAKWTPHRISAAVANNWESNLALRSFENLLDERGLGSTAPVVPQKAGRSFGLAPEGRSFQVRQHG